MFGELSRRNIMALGASAGIGLGLGSISTSALAKAAKLRVQAGSPKQGYHVMNHALLRKTFAAGLGLLLASAAAPIALADVPGYEFQDIDQHSSANASGSAASTSTATDAQIEAANRKADQALATAQQALREAQQAKQQPMQKAR